MKIRFLGTNVAVLGMAGLMLAITTYATVSPEPRGTERRDAQFQLTVLVEAVIPIARGTMGGLDTCRVRARVTRLVVARKSTVVPELDSAAHDPQPGEIIRTDLSCWAYDNKLLEPLAGHRVYYGGPDRFTRLEVWGSFVDGRFVLFDFVNRDRI